jgi:hypothetical protein
MAMVQGFKVQGSGKKQLPILIAAPPIVNAVGWRELWRLP